MNKVKKSISIDPEVLEMIKQKADKEERSVSQMIEIICRDRLKTP